MEGVPSVVKVAQAGVDDARGAGEGVVARLHTTIPSATVETLSVIRTKSVARVDAMRRELQKGGLEVKNVVDTMYTSSKCSRGQWLVAK